MMQSFSIHNQIDEILLKNEGLKLDFKREYKLNTKPPAGMDKQLWAKFIKGQRQEFVRDIISLANGNVNTVGEYAYLIIGVADKFSANGKRELFDCSDLELDEKQILEIVNKICEPALPDIIVERISREEKIIFCIIIPPTPYVHRIKEKIITAKGIFDEEGRLIRKVFLMRKDA